MSSSDHQDRQQAARQPESAPAIDLLSMFSILLRYRALVLGLGVLGLAAGIAAAVLMTPVYRAAVLVAPVEEEPMPQGLSSIAGQLGGLASIAGVSLGSDSDVDQNLAVLRSREFGMRFVESESLVPLLFADDWDPQQGRWRDPESAPAAGEIWETFDEDVRNISVDRGTGLVTLSVEWTDPDLAAAWANLMVNRINEDLKSRAVDEAERSLRYLNRELEGTTIVELRQAIYRLIEQQINKIMLANVREEFAFTVLDPAVPPDPDDIYRPNRPVLVVLGLVVGLILGGVLAVFLFLVKAVR